MATRYRDEGGIPRTYCKFLGKMVELEYCKKECTDRIQETAISRSGDSKQ